MYILKHCFRYLLFLLPACTLQAYAAREIPPAGQPEPHFRNFSIEQGLPSSETYYVHQDRQGYIWVCTDRGVARYDGDHFTTFTMDDGLLDNVIFKIYEDLKGRLWFVSKGFGLCYYQNGKIRPYRYNHVIHQKWKAYMDPDKSIAVDADGTLYYSCQQIGALKIDRYGHLQPIVNQPNTLSYQRIGNTFFWWSLHIPVPRKPKAKHIALHTSQDIYNRTGGSAVHIARSIATSNYIRPLQIPGDELVATNLRIFSRKYHKPVYSQDAMISVSAAAGYIWVGAMKQGITQFRMQQDKLVPVSHYLQGFSVTALCQDYQGGYWFSTLENGVFYSPNLCFLNYTKNHGLRDDYITTISGIGNKVIAGFMNSGLQEMQPPYQFYKANVIGGNTIIGHSASEIYISNFGVYKLSNLSKLYTPNWVSSFHTETHSVVASGGSIYRFFDDGRHELLYELQSSRVKKMQTVFAAVLVDAEQRVWAGNYFGLYEIADRVLKGPEKKHRLFRSRISALAYHPTWGGIAGTRGEGIFCFEGDRVLRQVSEKDGLLSHQINCLFADSSGGLWVGTSKGINYLTLRKDGSVNIAHFTTLHGLVSNEVTGIYRNQSTLWVGTKKGISRLALDQFERNGPSTDAIRFASLQAGNRLLTDNRKPFYFPGNQEEIITIRYNVLNYRLGSDRHMAFRLSATDQWQFTGIPEISLSNLAAGDYEVSVKYLNEDGVWSTPKTICTFTVALPFWATWYFITIVLMVLIAALFFLFRLRLKQIKRKHQLQKKMNQLEQKALRAQMNPHFIFNALNSIQRFLVQQENEQAEKYLLKFATLIRQTLNNSREPYISIASEISILEKYLELEQMRFQNKFQYQIHNDLTNADMQYGVPPMLIQPYVENAILHGFSQLESGGTVDLYFLELKNQQLTCLVDDNGIGRKASQRAASEYKSFGTTITAERLAAFQEKYGDHFRVEIIDKETAGAARGTKVILNIPVVTPAELKENQER